MSRDLDAVIGVFYRSHERRTNDYGLATWHRICLPEAGGLADQDAWTMQAMDFVRDVHNRLEQDRFTEAMKASEHGQPSDEQEL